MTVETFTGAGVAACAGGSGTGPETPTSAGLADCFEHAQNARKSARIAKLATIAIFCWRDQDESVVPEIGSSVDV